MPFSVTAGLRHRGSGPARAEHGDGLHLHQQLGDGQGANLDQWTDSGSDNQWWKLVPSKTVGYYQLVNVRNGWCADVKDAATTDGVKVIQWPATDGSNQDWQLVAL